MSSEKKSYICKNCNYPAQNETEFMDPKTQSIINKCPSCRSTETKTQHSYYVALAWETIKGMGLNQKISEVGDVYLKLIERDAYTPPPNQRIIVEMPEDIRNEMNNSIIRTQKILQDADIEEYFKLINVLILINAYG